MTKRRGKGTRSSHGADAQQASMNTEEASGDDSQSADIASLIERSQQGDRAAFEVLVKRTYLDMYTLALRLTTNKEDASDVVQDAYLRAWKAIGRFRGDAKFTTWMYRITANTAYTLIEKRRRKRTENLEDVGDLRDEQIRAKPEEAFQSNEFLGDVQAALATLPETLRSLIVLKDIYGLSHEEIADELGISVSAAKVRLHRGRKKLRQELFDEETGEIDGDVGATTNGVSEDTGRKKNAV